MSVTCKNCGWPIDWQKPFWVHVPTGWRKCVVFTGDTALPYQNGDDGKPRINVTIAPQLAEAEAMVTGQEAEEKAGRVRKTRASAPPTPVGTTPDSSPQTPQDESSS